MVVLPLVIVEQQVQAVAQVDLELAQDLVLPPERITPLPLVLVVQQKAMLGRRLETQAIILFFPQ